MFEDVVGLGDRLASLVDTLDPDRVSGSAAAEMWAGLDRVERLAAAGKTLLARRVAETHRSDQAGVKTAAEELARRGGTTTGAARDALDTSARLAELPAVEAAVRRGDLSAAQAALVSGAAAADPAAERRLLELAGSASLPELREECARVRAAADPDPEATNRRLHAGRRLRRFTDSDGFWTLIGKGTPQAGAALNAALDPIIDEVFQAARRQGRQEPHDAYAFDALLTLAERACGRAAPDIGSTSGSAAGYQPADLAPANVAPAAGYGDGAPSALPARRSTDDAYGDRTGAVERAALAGGPAQAAPPRRLNERYLALIRVDLQALRRGGVTGSELCEITGVGPIPVEVARQLLGDAVLKLVITRGVDVCNVTHLGRGPTAAQRVALAWASPGCTVEGCARTRIEYDHRQAWKTTRHTRLDELDPLCGYHHDLKTRLGWALVPGHGKRALVPPDDPRHPQQPTIRTDRTPRPVDSGPTHPTTRRPPPRRAPAQQTLPALSADRPRAP